MHETGCAQIVPPLGRADRRRLIEAALPCERNTMSAGTTPTLGQRDVESYWTTSPALSLRRVNGAMSPSPTPRFKGWVGGTVLLPRLRARLSTHQRRRGPSRSGPDSRTVEFPNSRGNRAPTDLLLAFWQPGSEPIASANDQDAERCAVAERAEQLTGNRIGLPAGPTTSSAEVPLDRSGSPSSMVSSSGSKPSRGPGERLPLSTVDRLSSGWPESGGDELLFGDEDSARLRRGDGASCATRTCIRLQWQSRRWPPG